MKLKNRLITCIMVIMLVFSSISLVYADTDTGTDQLGQAVTALSGNNENAGQEYNVLKEVLSYMAWFAFIIAIFKLIQIGISFLTGVGSRKSDAKSALLPWLVGAFICAMFGTLGPWFIGLIAEGDSGNIFDTTSSSTPSASQTSQQTSQEPPKEQTTTSEQQGESTVSDPRKLRLDGEKQEGKEYN